MKIKKMSENTWNDFYIGVKEMTVNGLTYTISGRRSLSDRIIYINYKFGWGGSYEIMFAYNCDYKYCMSELRKFIKLGYYSTAYYCDHKESGYLSDVICF